MKREREETVIEYEGFEALQSKRAEEVEESKFWNKNREKVVLFGLERRLCQVTRPSTISSFNFFFKKVESLELFLVNLPLSLLVIYRNCHFSF